VYWYLGQAVSLALSRADRGAMHAQACVGRPQWCQKALHVLLALQTHSAVTSALHYAELHEQRGSAKSSNAHTNTV
jgi:hypothetical protein